MAAAPLTLQVSRLHPEAILPIQTSEAGFDITCISRCKKGDATYIYGTGLAVSIPKGHVGLLVPRSSIYKTVWNMPNAPCIIDAGYHGELKMCLRQTRDETDRDVKYNKGDCIAQLVIVPIPTLVVEEVNKFDTDGGVNSLASSEE